MRRSLFGIEENAERREAETGLAMRFEFDWQRNAVLHRGRECRETDMMKSGNTVRFLLVVPAHFNVPSQLSR
jgi:hypothetical protein